MSGGGRRQGPQTLSRAAVLGVAVLLIAVGLAPRPASGQTSTASTVGVAPSYVSPTSWALGVVVPKNAQLAGGGGLLWGEVDNVTVQVTLPQINQTDGAVLAVLSLMTTDGNVLQLAAGLYPTRGMWLTYGQFISDIRASSQNYQWVANGTAPVMSPGDVVALSIYASSDVWNYELSDLSSHQSTQGQFPSSGTSIASGDQEVFAMESYSENSSVFEHMGNLTLQSVTLDGRRVVQGLYFYSNLDWETGPLFVVGGYAEPPSFISEEQTSGGAVVWSYVGEWTGQPPSLTLPLSLVAIAALAACVVAGAMIFLRIRQTGTTPTGPSEEPVPQG